eukprot:COSAG06_NODE_16802_length_980_cov_1.043133_1_plen_201_part_00
MLRKLVRLRHLRKNYNYALADDSVWDSADHSFAVSQVAEDDGWPRAASAPASPTMAASSPQARQQGISLDFVMDSPGWQDEGPMEVAHSAPAAASAPTATVEAQQAHSPRATDFGAETAHSLKLELQNMKLLAELEDVRLELARAYRQLEEERLHRMGRLERKQLRAIEGLRRRIERAEIGGRIPPRNPPRNPRSSGQQH